MSAKSILLIEDCLLLKEELTTMFRSDDEFQVIAEFEEDDTAGQLKSLNLQPDVVLLELGLEYTNNLTLLARLRQEIPAARIVAMDVRPLRLNIIDFVRSGGHALILKKSPGVDLQSRLLNAAQGGGVHSPQLTRSMFNQAMSNALIKGGHPFSDSYLLTTRERGIVTLIAGGLSNREIAGLLHITSYTVRSDVSTILEKLKVNSRLKIAAYIRKNYS